MTTDLIAALAAAAGADRETGRMVGTDRVGTIYVDEDRTQMSVPINDWLWQLRYGKEPDRGTLADDRMLAAGVLESYMYLVMECTKEEAWRRIKIMRAALKARQAG